MSSISIRWDRRAVKELADLERSDRGRVFRAVSRLADEPLRGRVLSGEWRGFRRLRVGEHRVLYAFDGKALHISVVRVAHRRNVYR